jgi:hypothetical protein
MDKLMTKKEKDFISGVIKKGSVNSDDKKMIYDLYRKYVDPNHTAPYIDSNCASCMSIQLMWQRVKEYNNKN